MLPALCAALLAAADPGETQYEDQLVAWALLQHPDRVVEAQPEGKTIEEVLIAAEEVFAPSDPWPGLLNIFHLRTREHVIRREVLLEVGRPWDAKLVEETERILRRLFIFAVARVIPVKGKSGGIALLVVTKDRWSLRLNSDFNLVGNLLQLLRLRPTEQNFLGRNQQVLVDFLLKLDTLSIAQQFQERRLFGSHLSFGEIAGIIINRDTGSVEGTSGDVAFGRPLVSLDQKWAWGVDGQWNFRTRRTFCGPRVCNVLSDDETVKVPLAYDVRTFSMGADVTRSFGTLWKTDVSAAVGGYSFQFAAPQGSALNQAQLELLQRDVLPKSEDVTFLLARMRFFKADFRVLRNADTFQLAEDYQIGPLFQAGARWGLPILNANHFVDLAGAVRYRVLTGNENLLTLSLAGSVRIVAGDVPKNRHFALEVNNVSPPFEGGRLVARVVYDYIKDDLDNRVVLLGGGNGLRGAEAEGQHGRNLFLTNLEYRSRAFELWTIYVGFVLFYDTGSAFDGVATLNPTHTVGMGLRILLPQFNQEVIRLDLGFTLGGDNRSLTDRFSATFGQVTDIRPSFLDDPL